MRLEPGRLVARQEAEVDQRGLDGHTGEALEFVPAPVALLNKNSRLDADTEESFFVEAGFVADNVAGLQRRGVEWGAGDTHWTFVDSQERADAMPCSRYVTALGLKPTHQFRGRSPSYLTTEHGGRRNRLHQSARITGKPGSSRL
jgi:hypothetical protein